MKLSGSLLWILVGALGILLAEPQLTISDLLHSAAAILLLLVIARTLIWFVIGVGSQPESVQRVRYVRVNADQTSAASKQDSTR